MQTRVEAVFFGVIAFLVAGQILAGFASLAFPEPAVVDPAHQLQVRDGTVCPVPASVQA